MPCDHKRVWETVIYEDLDDEGKQQILGEGWEPFNVMLIGKILLYHFKRLTPCQECAENIANAEKQVKEANSECVTTDGRGFVYIRHRYDVGNDNCIKCGKSIHSYDYDVKDYPLPKDFKDLAP